MQEFHILSCTETAFCFVFYAHILMITLTESLNIICPCCAVKVESVEKNSDITRISMMISPKKIMRQRKRITPLF